MKLLDIFLNDKEDKRRAINSLLNKKGTRPFKLNDMLKNTNKIRFTFISESRKMIGGLIPKLAKLYKVKVTGIKQKSYLVIVYKNELINLHKKIEKKYPNFKIPDLPNLLDFNKGDKLMLIFEKMLNDIIGAIDPHEIKLAEELGILIYKTVMKRYLEEEAEEGKKKYQGFEYKETERKKSVEELNGLEDMGFKKIGDVADLGMNGLLLRKIDEERASIDFSHLNTIASKIEIASEKKKSFRLNPLLVSGEIRKNFYKPKNPYRVLYQTPDDDQWRTGMITYEKSVLYIYEEHKNFLSDVYNWSISYPIYDSKIDIYDVENPYFEIKRHCEKNGLKITTSFGDRKFSDSLMVSNYISKELEFLYIAITFASTREIFFEPEQIKESCGMIRLNFVRLCVPKMMKLSKSKNVFEDEIFYLKVSCYPYNIFLKIDEPEEDYLINKKVYLPINNWFKKVNISVVACTKPENLDLGKYNVLAKSHILNYDMLCCPYLEERHKLLELDQEEQVSSNKQVFAEFTFCNLSNLLSYLQDPNNVNFIEGKRVYRDKLSFSKNELKVAIFRAHRIKNYLEIIIDETKSILRFKFPRLTYFTMTLVYIIIYFYDMNKIVSYIIFCMVVFSVINHKKYNPFFQKFLRNLCDPGTINKDYVETLVNTRRYIREHRYLEIELLRKKLKSPILTLRDKISKYFNQYNSAPFVTHMIVNYIEKTKNLLLWYDEQKSFVFIAVTSFLGILISLIPFKILIYLGLTVYLYKARRYYKKHYRFNRLAARRVILAIIKKHMPQYYGTLLKDQRQTYPFINNPNEMQKFNSKMIKMILRHLDIELNQLIVDNMGSLYELIMFVASTNEKLKIKEVAYLDDNLTLDDLKSKKPKILIWIKGFINTTPSDYFAIINR